MKKRILLGLAVIAALAVLFCCTHLILLHCFDYDMFDRSGWRTGDDGSVCYLDYHGQAVTGWHEIDGVRYYLDPQRGGNRVTGWLELEGNRYYLDENGGLVYGWLETGEGKYYLDYRGVLCTGWQQLSGSTYYFDETGLLQTGWILLGEDRFFANPDGEVLQAGWLEEGDSRYYLDETGRMVVGWLSLFGNRYYLNDMGTMVSGWSEIDGKRYYFDAGGVMQTGWLELPEGRYYLGQNGAVTTGWCELDGSRYYFQSDGRMSVGKTVIDGETFFFTSAGKPVLLVNQWNPVPKGYKAELVEIYGFKISAECKQPLLDMMNGCRDAGYSCQLNSAYRGIAFQQTLWDRRYNDYIAQGYSKSQAAALTTTIVLPPGTSEHHLGLAVDIVGNNEMYAWMAENSWEYGFILRYPEGKTDVTGVIYEPWHFRYVGPELARELHELGLTMEEYMDMLTEGSQPNE